jgi:hypothetical protein
VHVHNVHNVHVSTLKISCAHMIAADFSKIPSVSAFISELNKVIEFFNRSHAANKELEDG